MVTKDQNFGVYSLERALGEPIGAVRHPGTHLCPSFLIHPEASSHGIASPTQTALTSMPLPGGIQSSTAQQTEAGCSRLARTNTHSYTGSTEALVPSAAAAAQTAAKAGIQAEVTCSCTAPSQVIDMSTCSTEPHCQGDARVDNVCDWPPEQHIAIATNLASDNGAAAAAVQRPAAVPCLPLRLTTAAASLAAAGEQPWTQNTARAMRRAQQEIADMCARKGIPLPNEMAICFDLVGIRAMGSGTTSSRPVVTSVADSHAIDRPDSGSLPGRPSSATAALTIGSNTTAATPSTAAAAATPSATVAAARRSSDIRRPKLLSATGWGPGQHNPEEPQSSRVSAAGAVMVSAPSLSVMQLPTAMPTSLQLQSCNSQDLCTRSKPIVKPCFMWQQHKVWPGGGLGRQQRQQHQHQQYSQQQNQLQSGQQPSCQMDLSAMNAAVQYFIQHTTSISKHNGNRPGTADSFTRAHQPACVQHLLARVNNSLSMHKKLQRHADSNNSKSSEADSAHLWPHGQSLLSKQQSQQQQQGQLQHLSNGSLQVSQDLPAEWWTTADTPLSDPVLLRMPVWMRQALELELLELKDIM